MKSLYTAFWLFVTSSHALASPTSTLRTVAKRDDPIPPATTIGTPSNGHNTGDVVITIPDDDNKILSQIVSQNVCPDSKLRKRFVSDCFFKNGEALYGSMRNGGMHGLIAMANGGLELPIPPPEIDGGVFGQFDMMGNGVPGLDDQARGRLSRIVWWIQYPTLITHTKPEDPVKVIPSVVATRVAPAPPAQTTTKCHIPNRRPNCKNCGGAIGGQSSRNGGTCVGFGETWRLCPCLEDTPIPPVKHLIDLAAMQAFMDRQKNKANVTCMGTAVKQDLDLWSKLSDKACEGVDMSKKWSKEGMTIADVGNSQDYSHYQDYKYGFGWEPTANSLCPGDCKSVFAPSGTKCSDKEKSEISPVGFSTSGCGTSVFKVESRIPVKIACRNKAYQAPRGGKEADGGVSLDAAIAQFCTDNDGKVVKKGENVYQRYGITSYGVPNRNSFWLRGAITCNEEETMKKSDCVQALRDGMEQCDPNSGYSHGHAASVGCMDYSIDLSGSVHDDSPPWDEKPSFPPPNDLTRPGGGHHEVACDKDGVRVLTDDDLNKAIDAFCQDGAEIKGFGTQYNGVSNFFDYPPAGQPQFYDHEPYTMHLTMAAILNSANNGAGNDKANWKPYEDMRWCDNYDWKLGKDDCTYALRKMYKICSKPDSLIGGDFTYRCVRYKSHGINLRKDG